MGKALPRKKIPGPFPQYALWVKHQLMGNLVPKEHIRRRDEDV